MKANEANIKQLKRFLIENKMEPSFEPIMPILECLDESSFVTEHLFFVLKQVHLTLNENWLVAEDMELEEIAFFYPVVYFLSKHIILKEMLNDYLTKLRATEVLVQNLMKEIGYDEVDYAIQHFLKVIIFNGNTNQYIKKKYWRKDSLLFNKEQTDESMNVDGVTYILENSKALPKWQKELLFALMEEFNTLKPLDEVKYLIVSWGEYWKEYFLTKHGYKLSVTGMFELRRQVLFFLTNIENLFNSKKEKVKELFFHTDQSFLKQNELLLPEAVREYFQIIPSRPIFCVHQDTFKGDGLFLENIGRNYKQWRYIEIYLENLFFCWGTNVGVFIQIYDKPMLFSFDGKKFTRKYL